VVLEREGRVALQNRASRTLGLDVEALFSVGVDARVGGFLDDVRASGKSYTLVAADGGTVYRLEGSALDDFLVVVIVDVSEQGQADEELRQLRSRASLGIVAATLVHDFNNLLTPILVTSSRLVRELEEGTKKTMATLIHTSASLAAALTRDVLALARPRTPIVERATVNDTVLQIVPLAERLLGGETQLVLELDDDAGDAMLDRRRLEHALLNLIVNARDAMPEGGRLTITTRRLGDEVAVMVTDTGAGMTKDVREHAFDSFFTTKADSGGIGLGLTSVQRFAIESGGQVTLHTAEGVGTTVEIRLRRVCVDAAPSAPSTREVVCHGEGELILVADRDERVRRSIQLALEAEGYAVVEGASQDAVLETAAAHPVRVAILDEALLRRDPRGFVRRLLAVRPCLPLVFMTETSAEWPSGVAITVLSKAFTDSDLLRAVRQALDASARA
jgi:two-component system, cell cycle sensor histidine kinase and response regulator CckA